MLEVSDELYDTMVKRSPQFDGEYYVGIVSTGIVCFPSCRSRLPKRENVRAYRSLADALAAGFRPCKRCKPDNPIRRSPDEEMVLRVTMIFCEQLNKRITLSTLANELSISPYHLQRTFKRFTGISPAQRLLELRMDRAKMLLHQSQIRVAQVAEQVGFRSVPHFAATFAQTTGLTPTEYRQSRGAVTT